MVTFDHMWEIPLYSSIILKDLSSQNGDTKWWQVTDNAVYFYFFTPITCTSLTLKTHLYFWQIFIINKEATDTSCVG